MRGPLVDLARTARNFSLLASSRFRPDGTPDASVLSLEPMSAWEIVRLVSWMPTLRRLPHEDRVWLVKRVDGHPRTIEYLEILAREGERKLAPPGGHFSGDWRSQILEPILRKAASQIEADLLLPQVWEALSQGARQLLGECTVLTAPVPWEALLEKTEDPETARDLVDAGLLSPFQMRRGDSWWAPHRLVSEAMAPLWRGSPETAHRHFGRWFQRQFDENKTVELAIRAVEHLCDAKEADEAWPTASTLAIHLRNAGRYREALVWVERVLASAPTRARKALALMFLVQLQRLAGTLAEDAVPNLQEALPLAEAKDRGSIFFELGASYQAKGRLAEAAAALSAAIEADVAVYGEESSDVAASLHELAGVLKAQGDLAGARERFEQVLEIEERVYGTRDHYSTAITEMNLGFLLDELEQHEEATKLLAHAYAVFLRQLGVDHPYTKMLAGRFQSL